MRRVRLTGICLAMVLAIACADAAGASAQAPEFGRCVKQAGGKFKTGNCTTAAVPGEERFEWSPGVVKNKFTVVSKPETLVTFETVAGTKMTCTAESSTGEFTGTKTLSLTLSFTGCESGSLPCNSPGQPSGTVVTAPLVGELGVVKSGEPPTKTKLGLQLKPATGTVFAEFECGPLKFTISGSLIVAWPANRMASVYTIKLTARKGKQSIEKFEGAPPAVLEWNGSGGPNGQVGITAVWVFTLEEKVEASTIN